jgi:hypothetical protein
MISPLGMFAGQADDYFSDIKLTGYIRAGDACLKEDDEQNMLSMLQRLAVPKVYI